MSDFIALAWSEAEPEAAAAAEGLARGLNQAGTWSCRHQATGFQIYAPVGRPLRIRPFATNGVILGDLFDLSGADAPPNIEGLGAGKGTAWAEALLERYWGRYVAILPAPGGGIDAVLRDPTGAIEAALWRRRGIWIVASSPEASPLAEFRPADGVDWSVIYDNLCDFTTTTAGSPLSGVGAVAPGALHSFAMDGRGVSGQLWRPARFARSVTNDWETARRGLRDRVEMCVGTLARDAGSILTEVSGGLDSSIVAACLSRQDRSRLFWIHHVTEMRGGDERPFARLLAEGLDLHIDERPKPPLDLAPEDIARTQFGVRPSFNGLDPRYDADIAEIASSRGIDSVFTGMGGDSLFFLSAFPEIAVDMVRRRGPAALASSDFAGLARWTRRSGWRLGRLAIAGALFGSTHPAARPAWVAPVLPLRTGGHPWMADTEDLPPAKVRHVEELVHTLLFHGCCLRGRRLDLVHPLLSQPIMEHCLRIPVDLLTRGGRDRALAREAFRERLPAGLIDRRSKGELGPYYSRAFASGLPAFREYLLDGRLAAQGLLLRTPLEAILTEEHLAQFGDFGALLRLVAVEAWVRRWSA